MKEIKIVFIISEICRRYNVTDFQLVSSSRQRNIVEARHMAMYVLRKKTAMTHLSIGKRFGDKDHTTVIHAVGKVESLSKVYPEFAEKLHDIMMSI